MGFYKTLVSPNYRKNGTSPKLVKFALEFSKKQAAREFKTTEQTVRR